MSPDAMAHCQDGAYALAVADPLRAARVLLKAVADTQTSGARSIVIRYLTEELKHSNPPLASSGAEPGSKPAGHGITPSAGGPNLSHPRGDDRGSPVAEGIVPASSALFGAGRTRGGATHSRRA